MTACAAVVVAAALVHPALSSGSSGLCHDSDHATALGSTTASHNAPGVLAQFYTAAATRLLSPLQEHTSSLVEQAKAAGKVSCPPEPANLRISYSQLSW